MKVDNQDTVYGIHSLKLVLAVVVIIFIVLLYVTKLSVFFEEKIGVSTGWLIAIIVLLYLLFFAYFIWKGAAYLSYIDDGNKLVIRTFKLAPWGGKKISMEIPFDKFYKYEIVEKWPKKELVLYVKKGNQILRYPPISVSSLTNEQFQQIKKSLDSLSR
ncbi:MAG: hypothetical protein PWR03_361 [Tenuifilum sp.]|jgi:energy-coupling factor transporter transmembrane protein EcfT|uniref:hypothetical protein n=1 Tax=Tenuifilum sp. TaxID=2760880 RepID=UPI0024AA156A|nr:hypothetical protein [Tenuifilum sp.]MDI3526178.1 hypothetical protein [Tenuifilum sp.]